MRKVALGRKWKVRDGHGAHILETVTFSREQELQFQSMASLRKSRRFLCWSVQPENWFEHRTAWVVMKFLMICDSFDLDFHTEDSATLQRCLCQWGEVLTATDAITMRGKICKLCLFRRNRQKDGYISSVFSLSPFLPNYLIWRNRFIQLWWWAT